MTFSGEPIIRIVDASIFQEDTTVLNNVNVKVDKGEFVYLVGRTGSGKSSLLKTLYCDLPLYMGSIRIAGFDLEKIKRKEVPLLRRKLGIIFQDFQLLPDRNVAENIYFVMKATGWKDSAKMKSRLAEVLMRVGLGAVSNKMPHQLSGGEQQRVVIARALINEPSLLIADEPTGNLDTATGAKIIELLFGLNQEEGTTLILVTHDNSLAYRCQRKLVMTSCKSSQQ